jgi:hypothetical protein
MAGFPLRCESSVSLKIRLDTNQREIDTPPLRGTVAPQCLLIFGVSEAQKQQRPPVAGRTVRCEPGNITREMGKGLSNAVDCPEVPDSAWLALTPRSLPRS